MLIFFSSSAAPSHSIGFKSLASVFTGSGNLSKVANEGFGASPFGLRDEGSRDVVEPLDTNDSDDPLGE